MTTIVGEIYPYLRRLSWVRGAIAGVMAAFTGLLAAMVLTLGIQVVRVPAAAGLAAGALIALYRFRSSLLVIFAGGLAVWAVYLALGGPRYLPGPMLLIFTGASREWRQWLHGWRPGWSMDATWRPWRKDLGQMRPTRKTVISGLVGLGLIGALAGGVGIASAATAATAPSPSAASTPSPTPPYGGRFGGMHGMAAGQAMPITAAATYLGLSQTDLQTQLQAGKSLADVAKARGKSVSGLEDAMVAAITSNINANTALTADQKSAMVAQAKTRIATMVTTAHPDGAGCGPMGGRMGGRMAGVAGMGLGA
jgi:hypothetical protein